jgi:hypothetical protein
MTDFDTSIESFLSRWSRRKRGASDDAASAPADSSPGFDPGSLPSIESIQAASDVRAFLAPGVPMELARRALRRAWSTDPTIRDFIGIAENQWDFTKADGVPGFGPLNFTPGLHRPTCELIEDDAHDDSIPHADQAAVGAFENAGDRTLSQRSPRHRCE